MAAAAEAEGVDFIRAAVEAKALSTCRCQWRGESSTSWRCRGYVGDRYLRYRYEFGLVIGMSSAPAFYLSPSAGDDDFDHGVVFFKL